MRFDHHRGTATAAGALLPDLDPDRGTYYAVLKPSSCIVEVFGDARTIDLTDPTRDWHVAYPRLPRDLHLFDLRGNGAMRAGSVAALAKIPGREETQAWSRYFYERPEYENADGLIYYNAHNDEVSIALYGRAEAALRCVPSRSTPLNDPAHHADLAEIADANGLYLFL